MVNQYKDNYFVQSILKEIRIPHSYSLDRGEALKVFKDMYYYYLT